jgi:hypothetical protein
MLHLAQVGLAEAQQIKAARKPNSSSTHHTQREAQSTQKTCSMGKGWFSLLKWPPPLNLRKVELFKGSDAVLSDNSKIRFGSAGVVSFFPLLDATSHLADVVTPPLCVMLPSH